MPKSFKEAMLADQKVAAQPEHRCISGIELERMQVQNKTLSGQNKCLLEKIKKLEAQLAESKAFNDTLEHNDAKHKAMLNAEAAKYRELQKRYVAQCTDMAKMQEKFAEADQAYLRRERVLHGIIAALRAKQ